MIGSLMICLSAVVLLVGMLAGIAMGIQQNFMLAPAHAHLNLIGGCCSTPYPIASETPIKPASTDHFMCQLVSACIPSFHRIIGGKHGGYFHGKS